jgi:alpha-tubulin suppressor-like RCC1 family protein
VGRNNAFGIKTDGTLWTWGNNYRGVFGTNQAHNTKVSSPVQVPGTTWDKIYTSNTTIAAIKTDGTLWTWGSNTNGVLGHNQTSNQNHRSSPTQIPGTTWAHVASGSENKLLATKTDGTLWGWGSGYSGGLGQNTSYPSGYLYSSPVQIPGTTWDFSADYKIGNADYGTAAIKTDGTMWVFGSNAYGQLGLNERSPFAQGGFSSPVQLPGTTWESVSVSYGHSISATKTDGTLWQWARNTVSTGGADYGDVAIPTQRSSPVQLPGTWGKVLVTRRNLLVQKVL